MFKGKVFCFTFTNLGKFKKKKSLFKKIPSLKYQKNKKDDG